MLGPLLDLIYEDIINSSKKKSVHRYDNITILSVLRQHDEQSLIVQYRAIEYAMVIWLVSYG
jgi:hypothetical protein